MNGGGRRGPDGRPDAQIEHRIETSWTARRGRRLPLLVTAMGAACAVLLLLWTTAHGLGVSPDSTVYVETARSLMAGEGFRAHGEPMTHFPPFYPLLLAIAGLVGSDFLESARILHAVLYGLNLALCALAVQTITQRNLAATLGVVGLLLASAPMLEVHAMVMSEAPFLTLSLAGYLLLAAHLAKPSRRLLTLAAAALGLAVATRYVGVALLPPMVLALLLLGRRSRAARLADVLLASAVAGAPLAVWVWRNLQQAGTATNRSLAFHPVGLMHLKTFITTLHDLALPLAAPGWLKALHLMAALALCLIAAVSLRRRAALKAAAVPRGLALGLVAVGFAVSYLLLLSASLSLFDAHTPVDARILLPAFLFLVLAGFGLACTLARARDGRVLGWAMLGLLGLCIAVNAGQALTQAKQIRRQGLWYASPAWRASATLAYVAGLPAELRLYSNGADVIRFITQREAVMLPVVTEPMTREPSPLRERELARVCREVQAREALVVYLDGVDWRWYMPEAQELATRCEIGVLKELADGVVYGPGVPPAASTAGGS